MKLKTLKDWRHDLPDFIMKELKAEAIKWIKFNSQKDVDCERTRGMVHWAKHFFNITEEDLK